MKIALIGYGKMGRLVEKIAEKRGHSIITKFSTQLRTLKERSQDLKEADLAIDFSTPSAALENLSLCLSLNKPLVIGTTGWEEDLPLAKEKVHTAKGSCLYAPNFSIGLYLFKEIITYAASLFQVCQEYDVCAIESHHRQKQDKPSGTAKMLKELLLKQMPRLQELNFCSVRCGSIPGTHTLHFDSPSDSLIFTHQARNGEGFAEGAIQAAEWLLNRQGFFTLDDFMQELEIK